MTFLRVAALVIAAAAGVVGVWKGTWAVGGSDSSCYALMAQSFARGTLQPQTTLAKDAPWPAAATTFAPGGFIPSPVRPGAASPVCAPGFALLLAPLHWALGADAIFLLTPAAGALLVFLTFLLGAHLSDEAGGFAAAVLIAVAPVFVFQLVQPMNDVVVAALWTAVFVLALRDRDRPVLLGALVGLALLVRPNLAPAAIVVAVWQLTIHAGRTPWFVLAAAPFVLLLFGLNAALYGHVLATGYGPVESLFHTNHIQPNLSHYSSALVDTQLAFPLLGFAAFLCGPHHRVQLRWLTGAAVALVSVYLLYRPLPEWWYLRFLLPALPLLTALAVRTLMCLPRWRWILAAVTVAVGAYSATSSAMEEALDLTALERRFRLAATVARDRLPENAVYLTVWESGSVRYHANRDALVWDSLEAASLDTAVEWLSSQGREPYLMLEEWEEPLFRDRFSAQSPLGRLDWPPRFAIDRRVRIYHPPDRARYWDGTPVPTEFVFADR